jgi:hypothetical protein
VTELKREIAIDWGDPASMRAGLQVVCDHIAAAENANHALAITIGVAVSAIERGASGSVGEVVLTTLDALGTIGLGSPVLESIRTTILNLAPAPANDGAPLTIVRSGEGGNQRATS